MKKKILQGQHFCDEVETVWYVVHTRQLYRIVTRYS